MTPLDYERLMPHMPVYREIKWSRQMGYHEHADRLQRLMDEEFEGEGEGENNYAYNYG